MENFVQYHNVEKIGYSASELDEPKIFTDKSVRYLSSNKVWLISGEGRSPKDYYLAAVFIVNRTSSDCYDHPDFKNAAYGVGYIIGEKIYLNGLPWFERLKSEMSNFRNGLTQIKDISVIKEMERITSKYSL